MTKMGFDQTHNVTDIRWRLSEASAIDGLHRHGGIQGRFEARRRPIATDWIAKHPERNAASRRIKATRNGPKIVLD